MLTLRRSSVWSLPGSAKAFALAWLGTTLIAGLVGLIDLVPFHYAGRQFALSAAMAFMAIAVTAILRGRGDPMRLAFGFIIIGTVAAALKMIIVRIPNGAFDLAPWTDIVLIGWSIAAAGRLAQSAAGWAKPVARIIVNLVIAMVIVTASEWDFIQLRLSSQLLNVDGDPAYEPIDAEALWTAQPRLVAKAAEPLTVARKPGRSAYLIAMATGGRQELFGREARAVLAELKGKFGDQSPVVLLSNARKDLRSIPLANRTNFRNAVAAIRNRYNPEGDVVVIFLTSHGGRDATLSTDLPDYTQLAPISAEFLAKTLDDANIRRRVIIVSACYSGAWITPLASPETIVITASAADRTSFGCDDSRTYTVFGQSVIDSALDHGVSLRDAFADIKRRVAREEAEWGVRRSLPQAYVGSRMKSVWEDPGPFTDRAN